MSDNQHQRDQMASAQRDIEEPGREEDSWPGEPFPGREPTETEAHPGPTSRLTDTDIMHLLSAADRDQKRWPAGNEPWTEFRKELTKIRTERSQDHEPGISP